MTWAKPPARVRQWDGPTPTPRAAPVRIADHKAKLVMPLPKDAPVRYDPYRRLVAALPCCNCGIAGLSQAAHGPTLGAGIKAGDDKTFPLCCDRPGVVGCHFLFDQYRLFNAATRVLKAAEWASATADQLKASA